MSDLEQRLEEGEISYILRNMTEESWGDVVFSQYNGSEHQFSNLVLRSQNVFIGDIDFSPTLSITAALNKVASVEKSFNCSFRVYKTYKGLRVINTTELLPYRKLSGYETERPRLHRMLHDLKCDEKYIQFCEFRGEYAARLSPKNSRPEEFEICELLRTGPKIKNSQILFVVKLHDSFCLDSEIWCQNWRCYNN